MTTNVRDLFDGRLEASLAYVFAQLRLLGAKDDAARRREPHYHLRLTSEQKRAVRRQLRRDLKASLELCKPQDRS